LPLHRQNLSESITVIIKNSFDFDDLYKIGKNKIGSWMPWGGQSKLKQQV